MSELRDKIKVTVDGAFAALLPEVLDEVEVFRDRDQQASPTQLGEWAMFVASKREYVAEGLRGAQLALDLVKVMQQAAEDFMGDAVDESLITNAQTLVNRGFAAAERQAYANVSQVDDMVDVRAGRVQLARMEGVVRQLRALHAEWRASEFTLDRMIRVTQLRLSVSEI